MSDKITLAVVFCAVFFVLRFAGKIVLPFAVAFVLALFVRKLAAKIKTVTGLSTRAGGFVCLVLVYLSCIIVLFLVIRFLLFKLKELPQILPNIYMEKIQPYLNEIFSRITYNGFSLQLSQMIADLVKNASVKLFSFVANAALKLPEILFSVFVCVLSSFFICFDYSKIKKYFTLKLGPKSIGKIKSIKKVIENTAIKMLVCYGTLFAVTFLQLFIGLKLFNVEHAFVFSVVIAVADALPMIGTGTVLIPWAIVCFVCGNLPLGIGLVALFLIITIVRNILEPKIIGKKIGIHPLVTLVVMYVGICIGGIFSAMLLLFLITITKYLNEQNEFSPSN